MKIMQMYIHIYSHTVFLTLKAAGKFTTEYVLNRNQRNTTSKRKSQTFVKNFVLQNFGTTSAR